MLKRILLALPLAAAALAFTTAASPPPPVQPTEWIECMQRNDDRCQRLYAYESPEYNECMEIRSSNCSGLEGDPAEPDGGQWCVWWEGRRYCY